jgi:hypothetical protein
MNAEEFNKEELNEVSTLISNLESRIKSIKESIMRESGWANKENLRHSLRVNENLLVQAKKIFWEENL